MHKNGLKNLFIDLIRRSNNLFTSKLLVKTLVKEKDIVGSKCTASRAIKSLLDDNKVIYAGNGQYLSAEEFIDSEFTGINYLPVTKDYFIVILKDIDSYVKEREFFTNEILSNRQINSLFAYDSMCDAAQEVMAEVKKVLILARIVDVNSDGSIVRRIHLNRWNKFFKLVMKYRVFVEEQNLSYKLNPYRDKFISNIAFAIRQLSKNHPYSFKQIFDTAILSLEQEEIDVQDFVEASVSGVIGAEVALGYLEKIGDFYRVK